MVKRTERENTYAEAHPYIALVAGHSDEHLFVFNVIDFINCADICVAQA